MTTGTVGSGEGDGSGEGAGNGEGSTMVLVGAGSGGGGGGGPGGPPYFVGVAAGEHPMVQAAEAPTHAPAARDMTLVKNDLRVWDGKAMAGSFRGRLKTTMMQGKEQTWERGTDAMRPTPTVRDQLDTAIDDFADRMVALFLAEARRAEARSRRPRRSLRARVSFDVRCLPANTNASAFLDGFLRAVRSATPRLDDPAWLLMLGLLGLLTNARMVEDVPPGSIRRRPALRCVS